MDDWKVWLYRGMNIVLLLVLVYLGFTILSVVAA